MHSVVDTAVQLCKANAQCHLGKSGEGAVCVCEGETVLQLTVHTGV